MRITVKIALAITLLTALVVSVLGLVSVRRETGLIQRDLERDVRIVAESLAASLVGEDLTEDRLSQLDGALADLGQAEPGAQVDFLSAAEFRALQAQRPTGSEAGLDPARPVIVYQDSRNVHAVMPLLSGAELRGAVLVTQSSSIRDEFARRAVRSTAASVALILALSSLVALILGRLLVGDRVDELVTAARAVAGGDLTEQLDSRGNDELGVLMREVNRMTSQLQSARVGESLEMARRQRAELHLRHAERLATVGQLAAGIAHELGTPLNVISGRAALIESRAEGPTASDAAVVSDQARRVTGIVRQLLGFARREPARRLPCDAEQIAQKVVNLLSSDSRGNDVELRLVAERGPFRVIADPVQLGQVLTNLVRNAVQAAPAGSEIELRLTRGAGAAGDTIDLSVVDRGPGVPDDLKPRVFDPFFTTKEPGDGTGLGLSVVHGIVADHEGEVELVDTPGGGATFTVRLPAAPADSEG